MAKYSQDEIKMALEWLSKARVGVTTLDYLASDIAEKVNGFINKLEQEVINLAPAESETQPASEAGGTDTSTPSREEKIQYIRKTLVHLLGYAGAWEQETFTATVSDHEVNECYEQMKRLNKDK